MSETNQAAEQENNAVVAKNKPSSVLAPDISKARMNDIIETRIEVVSKLKNYVPKKDALNRETDILAGRYRIQCNSPLANFSYGSVKAYVATDDLDSESSIYAAVCDPAFTPRINLLEFLTGLDQPHIVQPIASGVVRLSNLQQERMVIIFRRPDGVKLSELIKAGRKFNQDALVNSIIKPISAVLSSLAGSGLAHGRIHPDNIYIGSRTQLGECICEPAGMSQETIYEPIERIDLMPYGKGGGTVNTDIYALGVLLMDMIVDLAKIRELEKDRFITLLHNVGAYTLFTVDLKIFIDLNDVLRGSLNNSAIDRWGDEQLKLWVDGKRFNLVPPVTPRDSSRSFEFDGEQFYSPRLLAHAFFKKWEDARNFVRRSNLSKWLELTVNKDAADSFQRSISLTGGENASTTKFNNELLARTIITLDPQGGIYYDSLGFNLDGLGNIMNFAVRNNRHQDISLVMEILSHELTEFWMSNAISSNDRLVKIQYNLSRMRTTLKAKSLGFGVERVMYDLSPQSPCLSSHLNGRYITSVEELLHILDNMARDQAVSLSLLDKHIAAFLASRAGISSEISFYEFSNFPLFSNNNELLAIKIIAAAQKKSGIKGLTGLSCWAALRIIDMFEHVHSKQIRRDFCHEMMKVADSGDVPAVLDVLLNKSAFGRDNHGFTVASRLYKSNDSKIFKLKDVRILRNEAKDKGSRAALQTALLALSIMTYYLLRKYL